MRLDPWTKPFATEMTLPGDKSITHRAILFSALARGVTEAEGWLDAADTRASLRLVSALGVSVRSDSRAKLVLDSPGMEEWLEPASPIDCGNSGTTMRLAMGLLSAASGLSVLYGDESLSARPMGRVARPLAQLGAEIWTRHNGVAPVAIRGRALNSATVRLEVASAQVKSAVLLAGVRAKVALRVVEPVPTRDHTERMLTAMGAGAACEADGTIALDPGDLSPLSFKIPGDPSSGAFFAALAVLLPGSSLTLKNVSLNPGRLGFYHALEQMGARVELTVAGERPDPWGDIAIHSAPLCAVTIGANEVPGLIDELPLLALLATQAHGVTNITGAGELRVKESDRIRTTVEGLSRLGARVEELPDGFRIDGPTPLSGARVQSWGDHRIAMMLAVAAAVATSPIELDGGEAVAISYPKFFDTYTSLRG